MATKAASAPSFAPVEVPKMRRGGRKSSHFPPEVLEDAFTALNQANGEPIGTGETFDKKTIAQSRVQRLKASLQDAYELPEGTAISTRVYEVDGGKFAFALRLRAVE